jgi:hypothetical protein
MSLDDVLAFDLSRAVSTLGDIADSLGRLADRFAPQLAATPSGRVYQDTLAALMPLVGRDVTVHYGNHPQHALTITKGTLEVSSCADCGGPLDIDSVVRFDLMHDGERIGGLHIGRDEVMDVRAEDCGCVALSLTAGGVLVSVCGCDHIDPPREGDCE